MNINIKPLEACQMYIGFGCDDGQWIEEEKVRELEQNYKEAIEALI